MKNRASFQFNNNTSVRFDLDSFALPVALTTKKRNTIYTNYLSHLKGTKRKLLPEASPIPTHGYTYAARWGTWIFTADSTGIYVADENLLNFAVVDQTINPWQLCVANNRLFAIGMNRRRLIYSVNLQTNWTPATVLTGVIHIPESYGLCWDIVFYRNNLLVICENGLLTVNKSLVLNHLSDDSTILMSNINDNPISFWESDWFSLGYATDTQTLREVFLKTNKPLTLVVESNMTRRTISVKAANSVQKIKTNLRGDQFKISLIILVDNFAISNLSAVVQYGKRG